MLLILPGSLGIDNHATFPYWLFKKTDKCDITHKFPQREVSKLDVGETGRRHLALTPPNLRLIQTWEMECVTPLQV